MAIPPNFADQAQILLDPGRSSPAWPGELRVRAALAWFIMDWEDFFAGG
jgi:hypothetical protein